MLDPRTIMIAIPCYDGKVMAETTGALGTCQGLYAAVSLPTECSHVSLVRNIIAGQFMASHYEWLVCIDSDIAFTRADLELLLEACDTECEYSEPTGSSESSRPPRPTRTTLSQLAASPLTDGFGEDNRTLKAADLLVCAEYSFKNDELQAVRFGMGFVRIHRSVFEALQDLRHDGGPTVEVQRFQMEALEKALERVDIVDRHDLAEVVTLAEHLVKGKEDKAGAERLWRTNWKGRNYFDYFPSGPVISQFVPTAEWKGEDHGFFTLCMLAGIVPRIETRTRLNHIGRKAYPYFGPDLGGGQ